MKKSLYLIPLLCLISLCTGCPNIPWDSEYWYINNLTNSELAVEMSGNDNNSIIRLLIEPDEIIQLFTKQIGMRDDTQFGDLFSSSKGILANCTVVEVSLPDGTILHRWERAERDKPGKQFFNGSSWRYEEMISETSTHSWTFDILPEYVSPR